VTHTTQDTHQDDACGCKKSLLLDVTGQSANRIFYFGLLDVPVEYAHSKLQSGTCRKGKDPAMHLQEGRGPMESRPHPKQLEIAKTVTIPTTRCLGSTHGVSIIHMHPAASMGAALPMLSVQIISTSGLVL